MIRFLLVLLCLAFVVLGAYGMRRGWRNRLARQSTLPALPSEPADPGPAELTSTGLYVGSTFAGSWQDRVLHGRLGERAEATMTLHADGVLMDRQGSPPIYVPRELWREARLAPGLAGKVVGEGGLLVLRWQLGNELVDTGFRADDKTTYPKWVETINGKVRA
jgi:hypothetical protein